MKACLCYSTCSWQSSASLLSHLTQTHTVAINIYVVAIYNFTFLCKHSKIFIFYVVQGAY